MTQRIAMWSGPRNISTAMMRAFENRSDTKVIDEPFYACYLHESGSDHPMREEVIASQSTDWQEVIKELCQYPCDSEYFYQKHMTHHIPENMDLQWTMNMKHCFLIRHPKYVVNSYVQKRESASSADIGIERQYRLYSQISMTTGQNIPVVDAVRFLSDPAGSLQQICTLLDMPFLPEMLEWPKGRRESDGVWASHWYGNVESSSGFKSWKEPRLELDEAQQQLVKENEHFYELMLEESII